MKFIPNLFLSKIAQAELRSRNFTSSLNASEVRTIRKKVFDGNQLITRISIIFPGIGCDWFRLKNGCSMCSFSGIHREKDLRDETILQSFQSSLADIDEDEIAIDLYFGGSFLDNRLVSKNLRDNILSILAETGKVKTIMVESRPEYINSAALWEIKGQIKNKELEIGIGLETSSNFIRYFCINKGFNILEFEKALFAIKEICTPVIYILLKPIFLTEYEAIYDINKTLSYLSLVSPVKIILMPNNVQGSTITHILWRKGFYRPPWLWSIQKAITENNAIQMRVGGFSFEPKAIDSARNCHLCNSAVLNEIKEYNHSWNSKLFVSSCRCNYDWENEMSVPFDFEELKIRIKGFYGFLSQEHKVPKEYFRKAVNELDEWDENMFENNARQ